MSDNEEIIKNKLIYSTLFSYYNGTNKIHDLISVTHQKTSISLRLLDWLCTNYSKKHTIIIQSENGNCNVYLSYKTQLKAFSKKQFDPFCRRFRTNFTVRDENNEEISIETTLGQLNFFKWAISNNIIEYAKKYSISIEDDMNECLAVRKINTSKINKSKRISTSNRKSKSVVVAKSFTRYTTKVTVSFD